MSWSVLKSLRDRTLASTHIRNILAQTTPKPQKILVEFSSPNIAKPFHVGHLRSTLIGKFVANLLSAAGHNVVRLNFPGDWGTQFGLLHAGYKKWGNPDALAEKGVLHLLDVYVKANAAAANDENFYAAAKSIFKQLEEGQAEAKEFWQQMHTVSWEEFNRLYDILGVNFDDVTPESAYVGDAQRMIDSWVEAGIVKQTDQGAVGLQLSDQPGHDPFKQASFAVLRKADGSTVYLSRDVAALRARWREYAFDRCIYVVGSDQKAHLRDMKSVVSHAAASAHLNASSKKIAPGLEDLYPPDLADRIQHVSFGKVKGLSTRAGNVVFANDLIQSGQAAAEAFISESPNFRLSPGAETQRAATALAVTGWIIFEARHYRHDAYRFAWDKALRQKGETGTHLQYTHARLTSLVTKSMVSLNIEPEDIALISNSLSIGNLLIEPEALELLDLLNALHSPLQASIDDLEQRYIVQYLFELSKKTNRAISVLRVIESKNAPATIDSSKRDEGRDVALARLLLFSAARATLAELLGLLGVQAMDKL